MHTKLREQAVRLRKEQKMSYSKIREKLGVSKSTLSYWLREFPLSAERIRSLRKEGWEKGEAGREKFRLSMKRKREERAHTVYFKYLGKFKKISQESLFVAGLMLYLGEGDKKNYARIGLANTDPEIICFFVEWLEKFLAVERKEIKIQLQLYSTMDEQKEKAFWKKSLGATENQFYKSQIRVMAEGKYSYPESYRHGTCSVFIMGVVKKEELLLAIRAFLDRYSRLKLRV